VDGVVESNVRSCRFAAQRGAGDDAGLLLRDDRGGK
jgi:hypothetical protein